LPQRGIRGRGRTGTALSPGSLLPVVDEIIFVDSDRMKGKNVVARVPWTVAEKFFGDLMLDTKDVSAALLRLRLPTPEQLRPIISKLIVRSAMS